MKSWLISAVMVIVGIGWSSVALAHKEDYLDETFVYETIGKHVLGLEYRSTFIQESKRNEGEAFWTQSPFLEYGLTDKTMVELRGGWGTRRNLGQFEGAFVQVRHRFGEEGTYWVDPALGLEYEVEREEEHVNHFLVPTLVLSKDFGQWNVTANGFIRRGLEAGSPPWDFQYALGIRYGRQGLRYGVEFKDLGPDRRYFLPQLTFPLAHDWTAKVGVGSRLSPKSPDLIAECLIGWEFGEGQEGERQETE